MDSKENMKKVQQKKTKSTELMLHFDLKLDMDG